jgi:hypothetical protein
MDKIASPAELTAELRRLLAYAGGREPSRAKVAESLHELADRLAAKAPAKLKGKKLDNAISKAYYQHGDRIQVNIMDLGKIHDAAKKAYEAASTVEEADKALDDAMKAAIAKYRTN